MSAQLLKKSAVLIKRPTPLVPELKEEFVCLTPAREPIATVKALVPHLEGTRRHKSARTKGKRKGKKKHGKGVSENVSVPLLRGENLTATTVAFARSMLSPNHTYRFRLPYDTGTLAASGTGVFGATVTNFSPALAGNWTELAAIFDEFRCLECLTVFQPINRYQYLAAYPNKGTLGVAADINTAGLTYTSMEQLLTYQQSKLVSPEVPWSFRATRPTTEGQTWWAETLSPATYPGTACGLFGSGYTNNAVIGNLVTYYFVEFRMIF
jgi:hypothetical protein